MNLKSSDIKGFEDRLDKLSRVFNGGRGSGNFNPGQGRGVGKPGNGMSTKSDKMLHDTVKQMADIFSTMNKREGYKYSSSEDLVLKQGKFFTPEKRPDDIKLGPKKECFANAAKLALERSDLTYVEGYAMVNDRLPLPIAHAWCVDKKGRVVDNTWENPGVAYFGVPFKTSYLAKKLSETGVYGILSGSVGSSDFLKEGVPSEGIASIKKQKNSYEPSNKDRLSNLIYKMNEVTGKRGNPYHDEKGRFTFAPYQKYPLMEESVKKLATLYKNRRDIYDSGFYDAVYAERMKLHQEYSSEEEMKKSDKAIEDWIHGDTLEHKESVRFSDIDVALSKSLTREFHNQQTVYRGQYDSDTVDSKSITSWTPYEGQAVGFGKRAAQINDAEKVSLFKIKTTDKNVILSPEIIYSVDGIRDWLSQQEFIVQAPKTKAYHTEDVDSINPYKRYDVQNSYVWNNKDNGGGNPYHDEKGRFTSGPSSSSESGSKSSILEKGGIGEGYLGDTLDELDGAQLSKLAKNPIADLSDKRIREVASMRQKMYGTKEEFDLANQWLMSIVGNGADIMEKARLLKFNPSKEIELSRRIIGDKEVTLFRNQEGDFDKKKYKESRWGDIPHSHSSSGNDYTIKGNKNNILIHPEVLYSADIDDTFYRQEREYVVDNSKIEDVWRGIKL